MRRIPSAAAALLAFAGCAPLPSSLVDRVEVTSGGQGVEVAPRPAGCDVQFFRSRPPARAYDEVAALHLDVFGEVRAAAVQDALRVRACAAGADAVIVTRDFASAGGWVGMAGVAVSYPELREEHRAAYARQRADEDRERSVRRARRPAGVPDGWVEATLTRPVMLRSAAQRMSAERGEVDAGTVVWTEPAATGGYRRVWVSQGKAGFVEDSDLAVVRGEQKPSRVPAAAPAEAPRRE